MPNFTPTRSLLNPHFEGYKLSFTPTPNIQYVTLPQHVNQARAGISSLGFQKVASRVRHNHLAVGSGGNEAVYVAEDGSVTLVRVDGQDQSGPSFRTVFQLPEFVSGNARPKSEYPAAAYLCQNIWVVSDGHGSTSIIRIPQDGSAAQLLAAYDLMVNDSTVPVPFQLHSAAQVASDHAVLVVSTSGPRNEAVSATNIQEHYTFDIWGLKVSLPDPNAMVIDSIVPQPFEILWQQRGTHIPFHVAYIAGRQAFLMIGGSGYTDVSEPITQRPEPSADEIAPIPRAGESFDGEPSAVSQATPPPPYSWTQTDDSVTIAFALPGLTLKTTIHATFNRENISLKVGSPPLPQPLYSGALLWDTIDPSNSLWTWERGTASKAGLLTLHLEKAHRGTRWSSVFQQGFESVEVQETVDPSELANIREMLDKYTASLQENGGLGQGLPSLAEGERDTEVDSSIGHPFQITWVGGDVPSDDTSAIFLSLPLPGVQQPLSLVIKNDIDGPIFTLEGSVEWKHTATYPALSFVLASKRDTRFTYHVADKVVLAFDSGARNDGGGNVYIYRGSKPGEKWAKQSVFQQRPGAGALIGVGSIKGRDGKDVLLCLSERELALCRDVY
ncbi:hypothetical protein M422DRAFT_24802 [Sphaerobolus stellatus SS14]|nr:hypothetical protein M422DRAFT_24802 [Sphaerobolus stellatus SS14]